MGKPQTATYATVKEAVIKVIQKTYKSRIDVAKSLKNMQLIDLTAKEPKRDMLTKADNNAKSIEQAGLDIKYQEKLRRCLDREDNLKARMGKAYALIFTNFCTKAMQNCIEQYPDFPSKIEDDLIALLEVIKTLMHATVHAQYPFATLTDVLRQLVNATQQENEQLLDYVKQFKQLHDVCKTHWGTNLLDIFMTNMDAYKMRVMQLRNKHTRIMHLNIG